MTAILLGVSQGILSVSMGTLYEKIKEHNKNLHFSKILKEIRLEDDMKIIEALLIDISNSQNIHLRSVKICIEQIDRLVKLITEELESIKLKMIDYQYARSNRVLSYAQEYWPYSYYDSNVKLLKSHKADLDNRFELLLKLICVKSNNVLYHDNIYSNS